MGRGRGGVVSCLCFDQGFFGVQRTAWFDTPG